MNVALLKASFEMVVPDKEAFAYSFYKRLFSFYPETRSLFAQTDMQRQGVALMAMLAVVVAGVERGENLNPMLQRLGERHHAYGAEPEHYQLVVNALLETFHAYLGPEFTLEMQESWKQAFEMISTCMINASRQ